MPQKDGMGPQGKGPKTGRGLGNCASKSIQQENVQKDVSPAQKRPQRRGLGGRRGNL
jgi:hypothetical protein